MKDKPIMPPMPPSIRWEMESFMKGSKKEKRLNDAQFLRDLANHLEGNCVLYKQVENLREIAKRVDSNYRK